MNCESTTTSTPKDKKNLDETNLRKEATNALILEAKKASIRASLVGAQGW